LGGAAYCQPGDLVGVCGETGATSVLECGNVVKLNYIGPEEDPHARMLLALFTFPYI
jgi:hypothetical protein